MPKLCGDEDKTLSETVLEAISCLKGERVRLDEILDLLGRDGMLVVCVFLTLPFMVPVSIPGVSTVFGLMILLIGVGILANRRPPVPLFMRRKSFPTAKLKTALEKGIAWVRKLEKVSRPSLPRLTQGALMHRVNGLFLIAGALLLMAPFGFVPFSNTLPGIAVLFIAIGMLQQDGKAILTGYALTFGTVAYFAFLLLGGVAVLTRLWEALRAALGL